jgi:hypothetical protein
MKIGSKVIPKEGIEYRFAPQRRAGALGRLVERDCLDGSWAVRFEQEDPASENWFFEVELTEIEASEFESVESAIDYLLAQGYEVNISKK